MQLDEVVFAPVLTPRLLNGGLNSEDQVHLWATKVKKTPVHALIDAGVVGDWGVEVGHGDDFDVVKLNLEAAELYALVVNQTAGDPDE